MLTLGDFLAYYPDRKREQGVFNQKWNAKQELRRLKYDEERKNAVYYNSQRAVQIFMGVGTGNEEIFVKADPGIGKTCLTVGIAETRNGLITQYQENSNGVKTEDFKSSIILVRNEASARGVFKKDIIETCTDFSYMTEEQIKEKKSAGSKEYEKTKSRKVKPSYLIKTHEGFRNRIEKLTKQNIIDPRLYSNRVIIIDEVHELNSNSDFDDAGQLIQSKKLNYGPLFQFLNMSFGSIKVLVTATPIVNKAIDFVSVINLLLPAEDRISPDQFRDWISGDDLNLIRMRLEQNLAPRLIGRLSVIEASKKDIKTIVRSNESMPGLYPPGMNRKSDKGLWLSIMDSVDSDLNLHKIDYNYLASVYLDASLSIVSENKIGKDDEEEKNTKENAFQTKASQLENILWPDGTHGVKSEDRWMHINPSTDRIEFTKEFMNYFNRDMDNARDEYSRMYPSMAKSFQDRKGIRVESLVYNGDGTSINDATAVDIYCIMRVIRSRYSPSNADLIEQTLGIEYYNEVKQRWEYQFRLSNLGKESNLECSYVYNGFYQSGAVKTGLFYEMLGFERYFGETLSVDENGDINIKPANRYAIYYAGSSTKTKSSGVSIPKKENMDAAIQGRNVLQLFNHPANKHGDYLKILIGLPASAQSINLFNARQSHHFSRLWNEARNKQAETRADRPGNSHKAFIDEGIIQEELKEGQGILIGYNGDQNRVRVQPGVTEVWNEEQGRYVKTRKYVKLFRHAVYNKLAFDIGREKYPDKPIDLNIASLGINMYEGAQIKFLKSKLVLDLYERCAFDLTLSNDPKYTEAGKLTPLGWDFSKEEEVDYTTYNLFYAHRDMEIIKYRIRSHFQTNFRARMQDLDRICPEFHLSTVIKSLNIMIKDQEPIIDRSGNINFIKEQYNVFFLVKSLSETNRRSPNLMNYYCEYTHLRQDEDFEEIFAREEEVKVVEYLRRAVSITDDKNLLLNFKIIPFYSKLILFEKIVSEYATLVEENLINPRIYQAVLDSLRGYVSFAQKNGLIFHTLANESRFEISGRSQSRIIAEGDYGQIRVFDLRERVWRYVTKLEGIFFLSMIKDYYKTVNYRPSEFVFSGTRRVFKGSNVFSIQSTDFFNDSNTRMTKGNTVNKRSASTYGQQFTTIPEYILQMHLLSVDIEMYCMLQVYRMPTGNFNESPSRGFALIRLIRVPEELGEINATFNVNGEEVTKYFTISKFRTVDGKLFNQQIVYGERKANLSEMQLIGQRIICFTRLHPAILGWVFDEQLKGLDDEVEKPVPDIDEEMPLRNFYPSLYGQKKQNRRLKILPPYKEGYDHYNSLFDLLFPQFRENFVQIPLQGMQFSGYYFIDKDTYYGLYDDSHIVRTVMALPEFINPSNPPPRTYVSLSYVPPKSASKKPVVLTVESIYNDAWSPGVYSGGINRLMLIYCAFYLSKRITFA